jgi:DnaJ-class molecular chaperone
MDYYKILNVEKDATPEEIKKAFRKLSMIYHPDRQGGNEEKFKEINKAYEILSNPEERKKYDNPFTSGINMPSGNDIFKMFFNGGMPQEMNMNFNPGQFPNFNVFTNVTSNFLMKPPPIVKTLEISLTQAYEGINIPIEIERWIHQENNVKFTEKEKIYVNVPKGIDHNEIIILKERGNVIQSKCKGDIKCFIKIKNDTDFQRNGLNLVYNKKISLKESLCGFSFVIHHIDGKTYTINNTNGKIIHPHFKKQIPHMGMKRNASVGSLIIDFDVLFPNMLTEKQSDLIKQAFEE